MGGEGAILAMFLQHYVQGGPEYPITLDNGLSNVQYSDDYFLGNDLITGHDYPLFRCHLSTVRI